MGSDALNSPNEDDDGQTVEIEDTDDEQSTENQDQQDQDVEIVIDGKDGSQPKKQQRGFRIRVNKLNRKIRAAETDASQATEALALSEDKNKLLELALAQERENKSAPPNPADFDDGVADPKYVEALHHHNQQVIQAEVRKQTASIPAPKGDTDVPNPDLERRQTAHYEEAGQLGVKDYDEIEDKAIEVLGTNTVNQIIAASDKSPIILYYLGKNTRKAEEIVDIIETNPVGAAVEIGRLEERLKVQPQATTQQIPDPDDEILGGSPTAGQANKFQKRLDKARETVGEGKADMKTILDIKKAAKEAGVTIT